MSSIVEHHHALPSRWFYLQTAALILWAAATGYLVGSRDGRDWSRSSSYSTLTQTQTIGDETHTVTQTQTQSDENLTAPNQNKWDLFNEPAAPKP